MANASNAVPIKTQEGVYLSYPLGAVAVKRGWMMNMSVAGAAIKASDTVNEYFIGVAMEDVDNSTGSAGDKNIQVYFGPFEVASGETEAVTSVGALRYVQYNTTVAAAGTTSHDVLVGKIIGFIDSSHVLVDPRRQVSGIGT